MSERVRLEVLEGLARKEQIVEPTSCSLRYICAESMLWGCWAWSASGIVWVAVVAAHAR